MRWCPRLSGLITGFEGTRERKREEAGVANHFDTHVRPSSQLRLLSVHLWRNPCRLIVCCYGTPWKAVQKGSGFGVAGVMSTEVTPRRSTFFFLLLFLTTYPDVLGHSWLIPVNQGKIGSAIIHWGSQCASHCGLTASVTLEDSDSWSEVGAESEDEEPGAPANRGESAPPSEANGECLGPVGGLEPSVWWVVKGGVSWLWSP